MLIAIRSHSAERSARTFRGDPLIPFVSGTSIFLDEITRSDFSRDANDYVSKIESKIVLIDGSKLAELMVEFGVPVATDAIYTVKRIENDFFESI
jgi:restriction endonuclease Mrr